MAKKKTYAQRATKRLDDLCRKIIRLRDKDTCQRCGKHIEGSNSQPSHVIPKSISKYLRWVPSNIKLLCNSCHRWWHLNPLESARWFDEVFPNRFAGLLADRDIHFTWRKADYDEKEAELKAYLAELEAE